MAVYEELKRAINDLQFGWVHIFRAHRVKSVQIEKYPVPLREVFVYCAVVKKAFMVGISCARV